MDEPLEDELVLHVAAGTDLPTALAALPQEKPEASRSTWTVTAVLVFVAAIAWWPLSR